MRNFFMFLVALNATFFVWQWYQSEEANIPQFAYEDSVIPADNVEPIYLLGEFNLEETARQAPELKLTASEDPSIQSHPVAQLAESIEEELDDENVSEQSEASPQLVEG